MIAEIDLASSSSFNISVINEDNKPLKVEASVFNRLQDELGNFKESPTKDVLVFPPILEISPHQTKLLRLMVLPSNKKDASHFYYNLQVKELASMTPTSPRQSHPTTMGVNVQLTTAFHVPVIIYPEKKSFKVALEKVEIEGDTITTWLKNLSNSCIRIHDQKLFIRLNDKWELADKSAEGVNNLLVFGNTVKQKWTCSGCQTKAPHAIQLRGNIVNWEKLNVEKNL